METATSSVHASRSAPMQKKPSPRTNKSLALAGLFYARLINNSFTGDRINLPAKLPAMPLILMPKKGNLPGRRASVFILGLFIASCTHKLAPEGHYQSTPVVSDGMPDDWTLPLR